MGILDKLRQLFGSNQAISSDSKRFESIQSDATATESSSEQSSNFSSSPPSISIEKDSLQLGLAAGFTGRSLRNIEDSLTRIETQMATKDWINIELKMFLQSKLEAIQAILGSFAAEVDKAPEPLRTTLQEGIAKIQAHMPLTSQMRKIIAISINRKEISYEDLAKEMGITVSALRGLLSLTVRRSNDIERYEKDGKGWIKFIGNIENDDSSASKRSELEIYTESLLADRFEYVAKGLGYQVIRQERRSPDFIIEKDSKKIGVELKFSTGSPMLQQALGQLTYAKSQGLDEIWLVVPPISSAIPKQWLTIFRNNGIRVFYLDGQNLVELSILD